MSEKEKIMIENDVKILFSNFYDFDMNQWLLLHELKIDNYISDFKHKCIAGRLNSNNVAQACNILTTITLNDGTVIKIY